MQPTLTQQRSASPSGERVKALSGAFLIAVASLFLYHVNPLEQLAWLRCPVNLTTGLYCPGCGSLRAIHALLNGELLSALSCNLLAVIALPILLISGVITLAKVLRGQSTTVSIRPLWTWTTFWAVILFTILRNLPFPVLEFLKP